MPPGEIHLKALDPFNCSFNAGIAPGMRRVPLSSLFTSNMANPGGCPANSRLPPTAATSTSSRPNSPSFHLSSSHPEVGSSRHESFFCPGVNLVPRPNRDYTQIVLNVCSLTHRESAS